MASIEIENKEYKGIEYKIVFRTGNEWGDSNDKFAVEGDFPFSKCQHQHQDVNEVRKKVFNQIDTWIAKEPKNNKEWVQLISECVIQTDHEEWHVDPTLAMNVLDRYAKLKVAKV